MLPSVYETVHIFGKSLKWTKSLFFFLNFIQPWVIDLEICAYHLHNLNRYMENNLNFPPLVVRIEPLVLWCVFLYQRLVLWIQYQCLLKQIQIIHEYPICIHYSPKKNWGTTEIFLKNITDFKFRHVTFKLFDMYITVGFRG